MLSTKATFLRLAKQKHQGKPIEGVGEYTRKLDTALPGKHTRLLYNSFKHTEAGLLAQLHTGIAQLNRYLYRIGVPETDLCTCGQAKETVEHLLFPCSCWNQYRERMLQQTDTKMGCLSFCLEGKAFSGVDPKVLQAVAFGLFSAEPDLVVAIFILASAIYQVFKGDLLDIPAP